MKEIIKIFNGGETTNYNLRFDVPKWHTILNFEQYLDKIITKKPFKQLNITSTGKNIGRFFVSHDLDVFSGNPYILASRDSNNSMVKISNLDSTPIISYVDIKANKKINRNSWIYEHNEYVSEVGVKKWLMYLSLDSGTDKSGSIYVEKQDGTWVSSGTQYSSNFEFHPPIYHKHDGKLYNSNGIDTITVFDKTSEKFEIATYSNGNKLTFTELKKIVSLAEYNGKLAVNGIKRSGEAVIYYVDVKNAPQGHIDAYTELGLRNLKYLTVLNGALIGVSTSNDNHKLSILSIGYGGYTIMNELEYDEVYLNVNRDFQIIDNKIWIQLYTDKYHALEDAGGISEISLYSIDNNGKLMQERGFNKQIKNFIKAGGKLFIAEENGNNNGNLSYETDDVDSLHEAEAMFIVPYIIGETSTKNKRLQKITISFDYINKSVYQKDWYDNLTVPEMTISVREAGGEWEELTTGALNTYDLEAGNENKGLFTVSWGGIEHEITKKLEISKKDGEETEIPLFRKLQVRGTVKGHPLAINEIITEYKNYENDGRD